MKFRLKTTTEVEAIKYQAELGNNRMMNWLSLHGANVTGWLFHDGEIIIRILGVNHKVSDGDWIIKNANGDFYPCKADDFEATYEAVE